MPDGELRRVARIGARSPELVSPHQLRVLCRHLTRMDAEGPLPDDIAVLADRGRTRPLALAPPQIAACCEFLRASIAND